MTNNTKKYKKVNCAPLSKNNTVKNSCYNKKTLDLIKKEYNKNHPNDPIVSKSPTKIIEELKNKMKSCNKEDCWLQEIKDKKLKSFINETLFAPKKPSEWKSNPHTWLSNYDILDVLTQYEQAYPNFDFIGPTPIDFDSKPYMLNDSCVWQELCDFNLKRFIDKKKDKIGIIFNLDKHNEPGSHWVSMFIDLRDKFIFYMDSALNPIPEEIISLKNKIIKQAEHLDIHLDFDNNYPIMHQRGNNECGMYSLFFIITMLTGKVKNKTFKSKKQKIKYFKKRIPDSYVFQYRDVYFNN